MLKRLFFLCLIVIPACSFSQKKEIAQAKSYIKAGNNLSNAEESMRNLLKDSVNRNNEKIWLTLFDAIKKQYNKGNEELYLKNKYDTSALFVAAKKMFDVLEGLDSVDAKPDGKGRVRLKYRKRHADFLSAYRPNLYGGGLFFVRKQNYQQAYECFDAYVGCKDQPLFSEYDYLENDTLLPRAAYMTVYCGSKLGDADKTLKYVGLALQDTAMLDNMLQHLSKTYNLTGDTVKYKSLLDAGFKRFPGTMYYFSRLFDLYYECEDMKNALELCETALENDSANSVFLFAKSTVLLNLGRYDECVSISDGLIAQNDSLADAYLNAGLAYFNQAARIGMSVMESRKQKSRMLSLYKRAMPYMQRYRLLRPDNKDKWGMPLYSIYFNLNMGKEFEEIEAVLGKNDNGGK